MVQCSSFRQAPGVGAGLPGVPRMGDPTIHRRGARPQQDGVYDDNGNFVARGGMGRPGWQGATSPGLSATSSNRFGSDDGSGTGGGSNNGRGNNMNGGLGMGGFGMGMGMNGMNSANGMGGNGMGGNGMGGNGMGGMNPFGVNMNMLAMGISPETQLLAAQMAQAQMAAAASGGAFGMGGAGWIGMQQGQGLHSAGVGRMMRPPNSARTPKSANSMTSSRGVDSAGGGTPKGEEDVDPALLTDIPAWLRSLRLHKYTPNFENMRWQDMVIMDEAALEGKGVAALGARRKMLKTFEIVRKKMGIEGGPPMTSP